MKKYLLVIIVFIATVTGCENDDFCTQNPVTPNLVIKFMDATDNTTLKTTDSLYVWAKNASNKVEDSLYINSSVDSILIPLNTASTSTTYNLAIGKNAIHQLKFSYENDSEYVSRSCGYRGIFNNVTITNTVISKPWINSLSTTEIPTIKNQANAHLIIYH